MSNLEKIYGNKKQWYLNRKEKISDLFFSTFKEYPNQFFSSSGRVEVLGNHTDHNNGLVLVSAIDSDIIAAVKKKDTDEIVLLSEGYEKCIVSLDSLEKSSDELGTSLSLIKGVCYKYKELGYKIGGFEAVISSNIFKGAGLSSSAAFELLIACILNNLYNNGSISRVEMAQIGQYAENEYFGKPSGLLDQMGVSLGGFNFVDFKDNSKPVIENFNFELKDYRIVLVNTGGSHNNLTKYYSSIKIDMKKVASFFNKDNLREVSKEDFYNSLPMLKRKVGGRAILRAIHFFDENERVITASEALKSGDIQTFLKMVNESGESSYKLLQNCFIEKDLKQGIALALEISKKTIKNGAVRVHGGGFKGTIIAYVSVNEQIEYINTMKKIFGERNVQKVNLRPVGVTLIEE